MSKETNIRVFVGSQEIVITNLTLNMIRETGRHTTVSIKGIVQPESCKLLSTGSSVLDIQLIPDGAESVIFCGLVTYWEIHVLKSGEVRY